MLFFYTPKILALEIGYALVHNPSEAENLLIILSDYIDCQIEDIYIKSDEAFLKEEIKLNKKYV